MSLNFSGLRWCLKVWFNLNQEEYQSVEYQYQSMNQTLSPTAHFQLWLLREPTFFDRVLIKMVSVNYRYKIRSRWSFFSYLVHSDGTSRIFSLSTIFPTTLCPSVIQIRASVVAPEWYLWRMFCQLSYSAAAMIVFMTKIVLIRCSWKSQSVQLIIPRLHISVVTNKVENDNYSTTWYRYFFQLSSVLLQVSYLFVVVLACH